MLTGNENNLRWWGIDLRRRWRRRVAVIGTYFVFLLLIAAGTIDCWAYRLLNILALVIMTTIWKSVSIFRTNGVVKSFDDHPPLIAGKVMVNGLDEWARYRFGVESFDAANEAQQADLLTRYRFGTFLVPAKPNSGWRLDERERGERDSAERWALKQMGIYLAIFAGLWADRFVRHRPIDPLEVGGDFWAFALLAVTLPQARVLWTEPDPREVSGEMELIQQEPSHVE